MDVDEDTALGALLAAAVAAEASEEALGVARAAYQREPSPERLEELRRESAIALEKEARFDEMWREASVRWFAMPHEPKPRARWPGAVA